MNNERFPLNYFKSALTPLKAFLGARQLNWPKMLVVLFFLNGLLLIPITLNYAKTDTFPMENTFPGIFKLIDESTVSAVGGSVATNGELSLAGTFEQTKDHGLVAGNLSAAALATAMEAENAIVFQKDGLILKEGKLPVSNIPYTKDFSLETVDSAKELKAVISRQWYIKNQVFVVLTYSMMLAVILFVMMFLMIMGSAFFLYLARRSPMVTIRTYKESVNIILNAITLPTVAAMLVGLLTYDVTIMMTIQTIGLAGMLVGMYFKTRFSTSISGKGARIPLR